MSEPLINVTRKQAMIFAGFLVFFEFLTYMANDMIMPGMVGVVNTFHVDSSNIASSLAAYVLGGASLQLILGPISDKIGRRPIMVAGSILFFICTLAIASSQSMEQFIVARFFQGMGLCFVGVVGYATIQEMFAEMDAVRLISLMSNVSIMAPLVGPLLGAFFVHFYSWRLIFIIISVCALLALWGLAKYMPETVGQIKKDGVKIKASSLSFNDIFSNYLKLLSNKSFIIGSIAAGALWVPCLAWIALAPVILVEGAHLSVIQYGVLQIPVFGAAVMGNIVLRRMTHNYGLKQIVIVGSFFIALGVFLMAVLPIEFGNDYFWLMPGVILFFFGMGITGGPLNRFVLFCTDVSKGTASALMSFFGMLIPGLSIKIFNHLYASHDNRYFAEGCLVAGLIYFITVSICFLISRERIIESDDVSALQAE